jgi:3-hydroxyisobutyrate dehydrogenase
MIAWFGTGLLGANFVRALRRRGEAVRVWNRTPAKARALEAEGALVFDDPAEAARGADRIHLALSDDASVDDVLERASLGIAKGAAILDHTTVAPAGVAARVLRWDERGVRFLHAPVFMGPPQALDSSGIMMASGEKGRFDALAPALTPMTGQLVYLGPDPARAAAFKLMGNLVLMSLGTACVDMLRLGKALGVPAEEAATLFDWFKPGGTIEPRVKRILAADFGNPLWELAMARKDARLMLEAADTLALMPAIAAEFDHWIARGHGQDDWLVIGKDTVAKG